MLQSAHWAAAGRFHPHFRKPYRSRGPKQSTRTASQDSCLLHMLFDLLPCAPAVFTFTNTFSLSNTWTLQACILLHYLVHNSRLRASQVMQLSSWDSSRLVQLRIMLWYAKVAFRQEIYAWPCWKLYTILGHPTRYNFYFCLYLDTFLLSENCCCRCVG